MGLDMLARATLEAFAQPVDFEVLESRDLHRWRNRYDLHFWMTALYDAKGGENEDLLDVPVLLTAADIDRLEEDIRTGSLPDPGDFFGGRPQGRMEEDLAFIARARKALQEGWTVYYTAF